MKVKQPRGKPLILITPSTQERGVEFSDLSISLSECYTNAIIAGGGMPWVVPCSTSEELVAEMVARADGILMTGGDDVNASVYTSKLPKKLGDTLEPAHPKRDLFELLLIKETFRQRKPLLAICRGIQILNVAFGGMMTVDIRTEVPRAIKHNRSDRKNAIVHQVAVAPGSRLEHITRTRKLGVNSSHHQAVGRVAEPFFVTARSPDGIVEGLELKPEAADWLPYMVAVQFHPERLFGRYKQHREIFADFVRACAC